MIETYLFFAICVIVGFIVGAFWGLSQPPFQIENIEVIDEEIVSPKLSVGEAYIEAKRTGGKTGC